VGSDALQLNSRYASGFLKTAVSSSEAESVRSFDNLKVTVEGGNIVVTLGRKFKATTSLPVNRSSSYFASVVRARTMSCSRRY
jgi:hypothetical protein